MFTRTVCATFGSRRRTGSLKKNNVAETVEVVERRMAKIFDDMSYMTIDEALDQQTRGITDGGRGIIQSSNCIDNNEINSCACADMVSIRYQNKQIFVNWLRKKRHTLI
jgi:hypothetical protein